MANEITDEMAKQVWDIYVEKSMDPTMTNLDCMCAILLAVAPRLRAQGMREAAALVKRSGVDWPERAILARVAELENDVPKKT